MTVSVASLISFKENERMVFEYHCSKIEKDILQGSGIYRGLFYSEPVRSVNSLVTVKKKLIRTGLSKRNI